MDSDSDDSTGDPPELRGVHFFTFRSIWYDHTHPEKGIGIAGIYTHLEPPEGFHFPLRFDRVFVYFQLWGDPGDYFPRIRLVRIETTSDNDEEEIHLGPDGAPREYRFPSKRPMTISGLNYVDEFAFPIGPVFIRETGLYEFQLWVDELDEPIARERVLARE